MSCRLPLSPAQALEGSDASHFVVQLRDINDRKFQSLYAWGAAAGVGTRLAGRGPARGL